MDLPKKIKEARQEAYTEKYFGSIPIWLWKVCLVGFVLCNLILLAGIVLLGNEIYQVKWEKEVIKKQLIQCYEKSRS